MRKGGYLLNIFYLFVGLVREVVRQKSILSTVSLTVRVDPPAPPLTVSKILKKSRPLIMNVYGLKRILAKKIFYHF